MTGKAGKSRRRREAGFTLLELLVALALMGLMASLALGGVQLGARTWETVGTRAEETGRAQMVRAFLSRELSQSAPLLLPVERGNERQLAYEGDSDSLTFVAPLAPQFGLGGLQRMRLAVVDDRDGAEGGKSLVLRRRPYYPDDDFTEDAESDEIHVLLEGIAEAGFSYRGMDESGAIGWSDGWRDRKALPALVRVRIGFTNGTGRDWPDLVAPRRITAAPECLFPAALRGCRGR